MHPGSVILRIQHAFSEVLLCHSFLTPPKIQLYYAQANSEYKAPVSEFDLAAMLFYSDGQTASQCMQGAKRSMPCMGICKTYGQLCNQTCPRFLGYTGSMNTSFRGNQYFVQDASGNIQQDITGMISASQSCSYSSVCSGSSGLASCSQIQINRAGWYSLKFVFPPCQQDVYRPWLSVPNPCPSPSVMSDIFYVSANPYVPGGSMAVLLSPIEGVVHQALSVQPLVQVVDAFGNLVDGSVVTVGLLTSPAQASPRVSLSWPGWSRNLGSFAGSSQFGGGLDESLVGGNRSATSRQGVASYTDLKIEAAMKQAVLQFTSDHGLQTVSAPFVVNPASFSALRIRQQPAVWEAGNPMLFEVGLLDSDLFLVEAEKAAVFVELQVDPAHGNITIRCPTGNQPCTKSLPVKGFVSFNLSISAALPSLRMRFLAMSSNKSNSVNSSQNISVYSASFITVHSAPARIAVSGPSYTQFRSEEPFSVTAGLSDEFGNLFSNLTSVHFDSNYVIGCDRILVQTVCDVVLCAAYNSGPASDLCCQIPKSSPMNNMFGCTPSKGANTTTVGHIYSIQIGYQDSGKPRLVRTNNSDFDFSVLVNSTSASLDGILVASASEGSVSFGSVSIGRIGTYSLRILMSKLSASTQPFSISKLQIFAIRL